MVVNFFTTHEKEGDIENQLLTVARHSQQIKDQKEEIRIGTPAEREEGGRGLESLKHVQLNRALAQGVLELTL